MRKIFTKQRVLSLLIKGMVKYKMGEHEFTILGKDGETHRIKNYLSERWPPFVDLWLAVWEKGDREPEIIDVMEYKGEN